MKNVLVTGGAGFIGSNLCDFLSKKNFKVFAIDDLSVGKKKNIFSNKKVKFYKLDVIKIDKLNNLDKIDIIIHLAAKAEILVQKSKENIYSHSNLSGLQSILNFSNIKKIKKFIFASSASVYGNTKNKKINENFPLNPEHFYAYTKVVGEKMVENYCKINKINFTIFRFFNIYGKRSNAVVAKFIAQNLQKKKITIYGNGKQKRDFIYINDLNDAIYKSIKDKKSKNKIYNLGAGKAVSILKLKSIISSKKNHIFLAKRNDDIEISISNNDKITKDLKWKPKTDFNEGVNKMRMLDKARLSKVKLTSIKKQKALIKQFNKNS